VEFIKGNVNYLFEVQVDTNILVLSMIDYINSKSIRHITQD
jgi:hypothetical protein